MKKFFIPYACCISNFYLAIEHKALIYIVFAFIFLAVSVLSYYLSHYRLYHFILIGIYGTLIYYLNYQNNIFGEYIADYRLLMLQVVLILLLSLIDMIKETPPKSGGISF